MELRRIRYQNVYGHLSGDLTFQRGENFLVGINGCGKTTVLNLIRWLLGPSLPDLCTLAHDLIALELKHGKYLYSIQSRIKKTEHELKLVTKDKSRNFKPIKTTLIFNPGTTRNDAYIRRAKEDYQHVSPEPHELPTWSFIVESLPSTVFVGLARDVDDSLPTSSRRTFRGRPRPSEDRSAVKTATELMRDANNTVTSQLVEINNDLNRRVLELSFSGVLRHGLSFDTHAANGMREKIGQLKASFTTLSDTGQYLKALSDAKVRTAIVKFLEDLEGLLPKSGAQSDPDDEIWLVLNQHNFERAAKMFDLFKNHEQRTRNVQKELDTFIETVDVFLSDSGKHIHFDADNGSPYFTSHTAEGRMSLSELSSGEAQVVILLTYFAFLAKTGVPIIIDEPELSLHVEWQKQFVQAVKRVLPEGCQTLMATHSPEICGANDVNVQAISVRHRR